MSDDNSTNSPSDSTPKVVEDQIGRKESRRLKAQEQKHDRVWFGLGMFGMVGWSVASPTLLGALIGMWIDGVQRGQRSWTLMLLILGLFAGCFNAWRWLSKESEVR